VGSRPLRPGFTLVGVEYRVVTRLRERSSADGAPRSLTSETFDAPPDPTMRVGLVGGDPPGFGRRSPVRVAADEG